MHFNTGCRAVSISLCFSLVLGISSLGHSAPPSNGAQQRPITASAATARQQMRRVVKPSASLEEQVAQLRATVNALQQQLAELTAAQPGGESLNNRIADLENVVRVSNSGVELVSPGSLVLRGPTNVTVDAGAKLTLNGSTAALNSPLLTASGTLKSPTAIHDSVVSKMYTPGAGNIW